MNVVYALEKWEEPHHGVSLFLAGPSPRRPDHHNWREEALDILSRSFTGTVFVPLPRDGNWADNYDDQIVWEIDHLRLADAIAFWVPRSDDLPGFTTNVEFGLFLRSDKIVLGYPIGAPKMRYLHALAAMHGVPVRLTLPETLESAISMLLLRYGEA